MYGLKQSPLSVLYMSQAETALTDLRIQPAYCLQVPHTYRANFVLHRFTDDHIRRTSKHLASDRWHRVLASSTSGSGVELGGIKFLLRTHQTS